MATLHSPVRTRSQAAALASDEGVPRAAEREDASALPGPSSETVEQGLRILVSELREMREEQSRLRGEFSEVLRRCDEGCQQRHGVQLSFSNNDSRREDTPNVAVADFRGEKNLKLKVDVFDGSISLREYFSQFDLIARANGWGEASKAVALATNLRGRARSVLESMENLENLSFSELRSKLELRFGEGLSQNFYTQFTNRRQKFGEDFASFGFELERLVRLAYPECSFQIRDKISCAQFISAISDDFVRKTLQLEGVTSLVSAIERAKAVKIIQEQSCEWKNEGKFERKPGNLNGNLGQFSSGQFNGGDRIFKKKTFGEVRKIGRERNESFNRGSANVRKECWQCGKLGHFRVECPALRLGGQKN